MRGLALLLLAPALALAQPAPQVAGELQLPLRRVPLVSGAMGINLIVEVDGTVKTWGSPGGEGAYLGDGTERSQKRPTTLAGVSDIVDAAVAPGHALVLRRDGVVLTWGRNRSCELTVKDDHRRLAPFPVPGITSAVSVAANLMTSAAILRDGSVMMWGRVGDGKDDPRDACTYLPRRIEGLAGVKKIVIGEGSVSALKHDGTVWGWGANKNGGLCDGTTEKRYQPVQVKGIADAVDIDEYGAAIVRADGTLWLCDRNRTTPQQVPGITTAVAVRSSSGTTFVRLKDGMLLGWGSGIFGALGNGKVEGDFPKPTPPIGLGPVIEQFWASNSAYALKADGMMMAWAFFIGDEGKRDWQLTPRQWRQMTMPE